MITAHNLGFPRIGFDRELKVALERFWRGESDETALCATGAELRLRHWRLQAEAGLDFVPTGDFSYYDQVLDGCALLGAVPKRFAHEGGPVPLATYFAMARGTQDRPAMEMTKWFDTNYHYIVPEFEPDTAFSISSAEIFEQTRQALEAGFKPKPVLLGPITFLRLGKNREGRTPSRLDLLPPLLQAYDGALERLAAMGVEWVQFDEPALVTDLPEEWLQAFERAYAELCGREKPKALLATYFGGVGEHAQRLMRLPVAGLHLDLVRAPGQLPQFLSADDGRKIYSLGVVDGRNVWAADLQNALATLERAKERLGERIWIAPSCSLLHVPIDASREERIDPELRPWLAFALQKLEEIALLKRAHVGGRDSVGPLLYAAHEARERRLGSAKLQDAAVRKRLAALNGAQFSRQSPFEERKAAQRERLDLPLLPTTTIGSFPQTPAIRQARRRLRAGEIDAAEYKRSIQAEIAHAVREQESLGLDVLVHGEAERNDMVEYFGEQLEGFAFTQHGWVQSYGSRYVKPPIIFGDVSRPAPMTVEWIGYAQSLTQKPVKGMLTGPVTILQWSFVRDDQPRSETALQIALAIRDETADLERAGVPIIQIDEPAIREGLPLKRADWNSYLDWAVRAFRVASSGVADGTQLHTHMCYSEFNDILPAIAALDADVITIESSRSQMEILDAFADFRYPNDIGPGVYDIHSPRIPSQEEIVALLDRAARVISPRQLWVNPDCGLKTRTWAEVTPSLRNMVGAARALRERLKATV